MQKRVNVITLGCSKNLSDSEVLLGQLNHAGLAAASEMRDDHDIVVVNTCGFIDLAKEESIETILHQVERKKAGEIEKLYVTGCLSQRYRGDLIQELPEVDGFFGTVELPLLLEEFNVDYRKDLLGSKRLTTPSHYAYVKISEGCNRTCGFCAIPLMRGKHISRPMEEIEHEIKHWVSKGVKEVMLIAQELTFYGLDLYKKRVLAELVQRLAQIEGLHWLRLHYAYPSQFPIDVIEVIRKEKVVCDYLDMPLQHASNEVLRRMRRNITQEKSRELITRIREIHPEICLRTTMLVGYPGETEEDHEQLIDFIEEMQFNRLGVFTYSHEEGTHGHKLEDDVPQEVKAERASHVMEVQEGISYNQNQKYVGEVITALVDEVDAEGNAIGRSQWDSPEVDNDILIQTGDNYAPVGQMIQVKITEAGAFSLRGEMV
ncbi:MAG: 30S ribosomal protein S12 methylthiotransferase RimO [Bacteroidota bacterium]|nr:30S ribosomal protein S12 methylthiotransferase RimO [Bacteroidota bacterium]